MITIKRCNTRGFKKSETLPEVLGDPTYIKLYNGRKKRVIQLNNAATTPPLATTAKSTNEFLGYYGALHRGAGPRARMTCEVVEAAITSIRRFIGTSEDHTLMFTANTSSSINLLARILPLTSDDAIVISEIEHTSNNLPWQFNTPARVVEFRSSYCGAFDYDDLERILAETDRVKVIAVTGASNLTGYVADMEKLSILAKSAGAFLFVDAAQLAPHRAINMKQYGIDALAFSAHKVYAPYGLGVLALPSDLLEQTPVDPGGGSIDMIGDAGVIWAPPDVRHQTGTWNATGIAALGTSCQTLLDTGFGAIEAHERQLVEYFVQRLSTIDGLILHVPLDRYQAEHRIGTFTFSIPGMHHALVAAIMEHEYAIELRSGTICNHRLVRRWFNVDEAAQADIERRISTGDRLASYGIVRASIGLHNRYEDVDQLVNALKLLFSKQPELRYRPCAEHETFEPAD